MDEAHSTDYSLVLDNDGWTCFLLRARKRAMQNSIFLQPLFQIWVGLEDKICGPRVLIIYDTWNNNMK
ncbi:hypothetical protein ES319_D13G050800v1 [Gossypium barbadense]|nr:hypothetical protein ES319_D13G050800v1 [Gossypium barbadense]